MQSYVSTTILPFLQQQILKTFPEENIELHLSDDGEQLHFYYESLTNQSMGYLRDHVFIEFGMRNNTEPYDKHPIKPYLHEVVSQDIELPTPIIDTLSPIRTFWEKVTLIHVECHRNRFSQSPDKKAFFNASYAHYDHCLTQKFCLVPQLEHHTHLQLDFKQMRNAAMFYESPPSFKEMMDTINELEQTLNHLAV